jgi:hypothetical protein
MYHYIIIIIAIIIFFSYTIKKEDYYNINNPLKRYIDYNKWIKGKTATIYHKTEAINYEKIDKDFVPKKTSNLKTNCNNFNTCINY